jgi:hypothetical protein
MSVNPARPGGGPDDQAAAATGSMVSVQPRRANGVWSMKVVESGGYTRIVSDSEAWQLVMSVSVVSAEWPGASTTVVLGLVDRAAGAPNAAPFNRRLTPGKPVIEQGLVELLVKVRTAISVPRDAPPRTTRSARFLVPHSRVPATAELDARDGVDGAGVVEAAGLLDGGVELGGEDWVGPPGVVDTAGVLNGVVTGGDVG